MLTLKDCMDVADLEPEEIDAIAEHEHLSFTVALEKGAALLNETWGPPAIRQIMLDNLTAATVAGRPERAVALKLNYRRCCSHHPGGIDRRTAPRR